MNEYVVKVTKGKGTKTVKYFKNGTEVFSEGPTCFSNLSRPSQEIILSMDDVKEIRKRR